MHCLYTASRNVCPDASHSYAHRFLLQFLEFVHNFFVCGEKGKTKVIKVLDLACSVSSSDIRPKKEFSAIFPTS